MESFALKTNVNFENPKFENQNFILDRFSLSSFKTKQCYSYEEVRNDSKLSHLDHENGEKSLNLTLVSGLPSINKKFDWFHSTDPKPKKKQKETLEYFKVPCQSNVRHGNEVTSLTTHRLGNIENRLTQIEKQMKNFPIKEFVWKLNLTKVKNKKNGKFCVYSDAFYTHLGGYSMQLKLYPNGGFLAKLYSGIELVPCLILLDEEKIKPWSIHCIIKIEIDNPEVGGRDMETSYSIEYSHKKPNPDLSFYYPECYLDELKMRDGCLIIKCSAKVINVS